MAFLSSTSVLLASVATFMFLWTWLSRRQPTTALPPGPKGLPLVGNINDLPPPGVPEYQHWLKHKERYGPISSITVLGQTMIIVHDKEVAFELMEKRASKYSGRPSFKFGSDMCGWGDIMANLPYGPTHRLYRKYAYQQLGSKTAVAKYNSLQEVAVGRFLWRLLRDKGDNLVQHLNTEAAEVILDIVYDYSIEQHKPDPLVGAVDDALSQFSAAMVPGKWAVDVLPFLEHLPEWLPNSGYKETARQWKQNLMDVVDIPYTFAKDCMSSGDTTRTSFVSKSIEQAHQEETFDAKTEQAIKWSAASMYTGGADTSVSTMGGFFLAMSMFPDVQRKAQQEIDQVVGTERLPTAEDRERLPYVNAVVEEAQRWHPIAPMGLPHAVEEDDQIDGFRIPKGALLLPAVWWFTRDPTTYHDPEAFKPERFLAPYNEPSATNVTFGFGRRICPGRVLADASLYLTFAQSLAVFNIKNVVDEKGQIVEPKHTFDSGIISHPGPFGVRVEPRTGQSVRLVEKVVEENPWKDSDAQYIKRARV